MNSPLCWGTLGALGGLCWLRRQIQGYWYDRSFAAPQGAELRGRVVVVTGGNAGIGLAAAKLLCALGCHVVVGCRSAAKGAAAVAAISAAGPGSAEFALLDLCSPRSITAFVSAVRRRHPAVHALLCNAGISGMGGQGGGEPASAGQLVWQANYLGHWQLVEELRAACRVQRFASVSSGAHTGATIDFGDVARPGCSPYGQSKLAQIMHMQALQRRLDGGALAVSCTPGFVRTAIITGSVSALWRAVILLLWPVYALLGRSPAGGAQTLLHAALAPHAPGDAYFSNCTPKAATGKDGIANDEAAQEKLWELSERMVAEASAKEASSGAKL